MNTLNLFSGLFSSFSGSKALTTLAFIFCLCCFQTQAKASGQLTEATSSAAFAHLEANALQIVQVDGRTYQIDVPYRYFSISRRRWLKMEISFFVTVYSERLNYNRIRQEIKGLFKTASIGSLAKALISGRKAGITSFKVAVAKFLIQKLGEYISLRVKIYRR
ncbi:hypothetical protein BKI52_15435 [marine bacterium AO1-C]|nr:hypothetical protein BKI52_15435 [marine bacterium AO1-C]